MDAVCAVTVDIRTNIHLDVVFGSHTCPAQADGTGARTGNCDRAGAHAHVDHPLGRGRHGQIAAGGDAGVLHIGLR